MLLFQKKKLLYIFLFTQLFIRNETAASNSIYSTIDFLVFNVPKIISLALAVIPLLSIVFSCTITMLAFFASRIFFYFFFLPLDQASQPNQQRSAQPWAFARSRRRAQDVSSFLAQNASESSVAASSSVSATDARSQLTKMAGRRWNCCRYLTLILPLITSIRAHHI